MVIIIFRLCTKTIMYRFMLLCLIMLLHCSSINVVWYLDSNDVCYLGDNDACCLSDDDACYLCDDNVCFVMTNEKAHVIWYVSPR